MINAQHDSCDRYGKLTYNFSWKKAHERTGQYMAGFY